MLPISAGVTLWSTGAGIFSEVGVISLPTPKASVVTVYSPRSCFSAMTRFFAESVEGL
jgi:hypothetical protein